MHFIEVISLTLDTLKPVIKDTSFRDHPSSRHSTILRSLDQVSKTPFLMASASHVSDRVVRG